MRTGSPPTTTIEQERELAPRPDVTPEPDDAPVEPESLAGAEMQVAIFGRPVKLPSSLRALGHRNFRLFWSGQLVSLVGTWMQMIARGWLVLELTNSSFWLGMVGFATSLPSLLLTLWAGAIVDSVSKRTLIIWTQAIAMIGSFLLGALTLTGAVELWHVLAISVAMGTAFAFDAPARQAFTVEMVGKHDLMNAVALNSAIFNGARVVGPSVGAVILAWQGPGWAFIVNGVTYIAVLAGLFMMRMPRHVRKTETVGRTERVLEGLRYVRRHENLGTLMVIVAVVSIFAFPYTVLMPVFADHILRVGEQGYGTMMAVAGIGSLFGALSLTVQSGREDTRRGRIIMAGVIGLPMSLAVFALSTHYYVSLAALAVVGWTMISINATINTLVQTSVPDELRGRVNGVFAFLFIGMAPAGNLQAGILADNFGAPATLAIGAMICGVVTAYVLVRRRHIFAVE
ncbi:MAG TPA: MFS transporter [Chloroflexia bacterium]|nr:MFS transporter [Chloroflexia bacterium]